LLEHNIPMIKAITKVGSSQGIIFDSALMELAHLKPGDELNVEVHEGGTITLTPVRPKPSRKKVSRVIKSTLKDYALTMKKLA
jgi:antitoxin component of MazEF toxin-antitoxin module